MSKRVLDAIVHGIHVAGHIILAIFVTGLGIALTDPTIVGAFVKYVGHFGVPVAIVNVVIAAIIQYVQSKPLSSLTIDSLPDAPQS